MKSAGIGRMKLRPERLTIHCGHHVVCVNRHGLIQAPSDGYYLRQTRFISRFELSSEGKCVRPVSCAAVEPQSLIAYYLLRSPEGAEAAPPGDADPSGGEIVEKGIEIQLNTYVGGGYHQDVHFTNHALIEARVVLDWAFEADFADLDEVTSGKRRQDAAIRRSFTRCGPGRGELTLAYQHPELDHSTRIRIAAPGSLEDVSTTLRTTLLLRPREPALVSIDVAPVFLGKPSEPWYGLDGARLGGEAIEARRQAWLAGSLDFEASNPLVQAAWERAAADLWSLQSLDGEGDEIFTPIAGIPKYTGLFGRDSVVAGIQSAFLTASTLRGALASVGEWTAKGLDNRFDAEPGKVLHQHQMSPLALLDLTPFAHYYGDYSAPGLYLIGAALHFAWTGDRRAFESIRDKVCATLAWMDRDGDFDGDGFYEYRTLAGARGLKNQGWKDSSQAILYPDGSLVPDPIAVAEVQGLYYAAKQGLAGVFSALGESDRAARLIEEAVRLKKRFNELFWMPDERFFALALDPEKKPVKSIASNAGFCLACGIVDDDKAEAVARRLVAPDMFSGWGVRSLSSAHPAYNPLSYHLGSIWPVDAAHVCLGMKRYGFIEPMHKIAKALFEATRLFEFDRLPEVFGGNPRDGRHPFPGLYPGACSPQAWSASAIIQICHALAGVTPLAPLGAVIVDPALPDWMADLTIRNLAIGEQRLSIAFHRDGAGATDFEVIEGGEGLRIYRPDPTVGKDRFAAAVAEAWAARK